MSNTIYIPVTADTLKETEKAYQLRVSYWTTERAPIKTADIWAPKSCVQVTDGKVSAIADWILNKWVNEHVEYIKKHSARAAGKYNPCFDIERYHTAVEYNKEQIRKWNEELDTAVDIIVEFVTPYATNFMQETAYTGHLVYDTFKNSDLLTTEELTALKNISDRMEKSFGKWSKADDQNIKKFVEEFPSKYTTLKDVADFLWREIDFPTLGINVYNYEVRNKLKMPNGYIISDNTFSNALNGYETSFVGKKFKKNFAFHNEFRKIVNNIADRLCENK